MDSSTNEVRVKILNWFRDTKSSSGHVLDERNLYHSIMKELNPKQEKRIDEAINSLEEDELVEINDRKLMVLTEKGEDFLY